MSMSNWVQFGGTNEAMPTSDEERVVLFGNPDVPAPRMRVEVRQSKKAALRASWRVGPVSTSRKHGCGRNKPCPCGSGLKVKRCPCAGGARG